MIINIINTTIRIALDCQGTADCYIHILKKILCIYVDASFPKNYEWILIIKVDVYAILFGVDTFSGPVKFRLIRSGPVVDYYIERGNFVI